MTREGQSLDRARVAMGASVFGDLMPVKIFALDFLKTGRGMLHIKNIDVPSIFITRKVFGSMRC